MITTEEAERIDGEFEEAFAIETVSTRQAANKMYEAWQDLYSIMERENNYSDKQGSDILDWQLGNWANDVTMALHNALDNQERYSMEDDEQKIRQKICLQIQFLRVKQRKRSQGLHTEVGGSPKRHSG